MATSIISRWGAPVAIVAVAAAVMSGDPTLGTTVLAGILLLLAFGLSPLLLPRSPGDRSGQQSAEAGTAAVYWRPGCSVCLRLRVSLGLAGRRAVWVDISRDPDAAARVRSVNGGDETVPTVFVSDESRTNPDPSWVRSLVAT